MEEREKSKNISKDINKIEEQIRSFRKDAPIQRPGDRAYDVRKPLKTAREQERRLNFKLHKTERNEDVEIKRRKRNSDNSMRVD